MPAAWRGLELQFKAKGNVFGKFFKVGAGQASAGPEQCQARCSKAGLTVPARGKDTPSDYSRARSAILEGRGPQRYAVY